MKYAFLLFLLVLIPFSYAQLENSNLPRVNIDTSVNDVCYLSASQIFTGDNNFTGYNHFYNATIDNLITNEKNKNFSR